MLDDMYLYIYMYIYTVYAYTDTYIHIASVSGVASDSMMSPLLVLWPTSREKQKTICQNVKAGGGLKCVVFLTLVNGGYKEHLLQLSVRDDRNPYQSACWQGCA